MSIGGSGLGRWRACLVAVACLAIAVVSGCGGEDSSSGGGIKGEVRRIIDSLDSPELTCGQLTDRFLVESYGAPGDRGRRLCEVKARGKQPVAVRSIEFLVVRRDFSSAEITNELGGEAKLTFVSEGGRWLLDSAVYTQRPGTGGGSQV